MATAIVSEFLRQLTRQVEGASLADQSDRQLVAPLLFQD